MSSSSGANSSRVKSESLSSWFTLEPDWAGELVDPDNKDSETVGALFGGGDLSVIGEAFVGVSDAGGEMTEGEGGDILHLFVDEHLWPE